MSQEYGSSSARRRRAARANRNRPVLVSPEQEETLDTEGEEAGGQVVAPVITETEEPAAQTIDATESAQPKSPGRRLGGFFATLGKGTQETAAPEIQEQEQAQARIARATRKAAPAASMTTKTSAASTTKVEKEQPAQESKPAPRATARKPAAPGSTFKTRYIFGMVLYLLAANFIGIFEAQALQALHIDRVLSQFSLFGGQVVVRISTLVFLVTLVLILVLLAKLDLIPRTLGAAMGTQSGTSRSSSPARDSGDSFRSPQPTTRQGVPGDDDALYQQYRANVRREKKK